MGIIITIVWAAVVGFIIWKLPLFGKFGLQRKTLLAVYGIHVLAGIALTLIYSYHYPDRNLADTFKYFDDSKVLYEFLFTDPIEFFRIIVGYKSDNIHLKPVFEQMNNWYQINNKYFYNDNRTLIRINAILMIFSFGNYGVHLMFFCFCSFLGKLFIYKAFQNVFKERKTLLFLSIFLIPSVVFWSSGILKEGLLLLLLGLLFLGFERWAENPKSIKYFLISVLSVWGMFFVKFYVVITLTPGILAIFWLKRAQYKKPFLKMGITHAICVIAFLIFHFVSPFHSFINGLKWQKKNFYGLAKTMESGSVIETQDLENNLLSFILNLPEGFINGFFRPFIWQGFSSPVVMAAALENLLWIVLIFFAVKWFKKPDSKHLSYFLLFFSFTLLLFTVLGVVTPIIGTLVRYKIPALPFLVLSLFILINEEKTKFLEERIGKNL